MKFLEQYKGLLKLSAVRKVLETLLFLVPGSFETLGSKLSHGTSKKFADVRTHLRKVLKKMLYQSKESGTKIGHSLDSISSSHLRTVE